VTCPKVLLIVTNADERRRLLATWHDFVIRQPGTNFGSAPGAAQGEGPVAFSRLRVREGLNLAVFIVDGGWRREYVCRVLADEVDGYCLLISDNPADLSMGLGLSQLLAGTKLGLIAATVPGSEELVRSVLGLPADAAVPVVDCGNRQSVTGAVCELLEHLAALPAA